MKKRLISQKYSATVDMVYENKIKTEAEDDLEAIMKIQDKVEQDYPHQPPADSELISVDMVSL